MSSPTNIPYEEQDMDKLPPEAEVKEVECHHQCTSNCRKVGCNCECGEWHNE